MIVPSLLPLPPDVVVGPVLIDGVDATHKTVVVIDAVGLVYVNGVGTYATSGLHDNGRVGEGGQVVDWLFVLLHACRQVGLPLLQDGEVPAAWNKFGILQVRRVHIPVGADGPTRDEARWCSIRGMLVKKLTKNRNRWV